MNNTLNILSIDFDYFQDIPDESILTCYPDGHDFSTELSKIIWSNAYAYSKTADKIKSVNIMQSELNAAKAIINNTDPYAPNWIVNSHVHIYDAVKNARLSHPDADIHIYNIDMHHDCFAYEKTLTCGNWALHVMKGFNASVTWVTTPIGLKMCPPPDVLNNHILTSINDIPVKNFDAIFLCRSDIWLPPHLDCYFEELRQCMTNSFVTSFTDGQVSEPRDIQPLIDSLQQITWKGAPLCQLQK